MLTDRRDKPLAAVLSRQALLPDLISGEVYKNRVSRGRACPPPLPGVQIPFQELQKTPGGTWGLDWIFRVTGLFRAQPRRGGSAKNHHSDPAPKVPKRFLVQLLHICDQILLNPRVAVRWGLVSGKNWLLEELEVPPRSVKIVCSHSPLRLEGGVWNTPIPTWLYVKTLPWLLILLYLAVVPQTGLDQFFLFF